MTYEKETSCRNSPVRLNWRKHAESSSQKLVTAKLHLVTDKAVKILVQRQDAKPQSSRMLLIAAKFRPCLSMGPASPVVSVLKGWIATLLLSLHGVSDKEVGLLWRATVCYECAVCKRVLYTWSYFTSIVCNVDRWACFKYLIGAPQSPEEKGTAPVLRH